MRVLLLVFLLFAQPALAARIEGRVVDGDSPVSGMQVAAYRSLDPSGEPLALSAPSAPDGSYSLQVPAGYVALYAHDEAGRFAFCGRNPVQATNEQTTWAGLQLVPVTAAQQLAYDDEYSAALEGTVLFEGQPLAGALVHLYLDVNEDLKGQGYRLSLPTGDDGYFAFHSLPELDYFLVVRKRSSGERLGPLREGDLLGVYPGNPLKLRAGELTQIQFSVVRKLKEESGSETPNRASLFRLTGKIVDHHGKPQAGLHVFAYREKVIGHDRPAGLSSLTGVDGRFEVHLPEAGTYYVGARQFYGDSPGPGELFGMYEGSADHGLQVEAGRTAEISIEVVPVTLE